MRDEDGGMTEVADGELFTSANSAVVDLLRRQPMNNLARIATAHSAAESPNMNMATSEPWQPHEHRR